MNAISQTLKPRFRGGIHVFSFILAVSLIAPTVSSVSGLENRLVVLLYSASITLLFGVSALYHRIKWNNSLERWIRQLDHSLIFVAIAATYTPIAVFTLTPWVGKFLLIIVWGGSAVGIAIRFFFADVSPKAIALPYILVGWSLLLVVSDAWSNLGALGFVLIFTGGVSYTIGALVFAFQKPDPWPNTFGFHEVFHSLTFLGAALHYCVITFIVIPMA